MGLPPRKICEIVCQLNGSETGLSYDGEEPRVIVYLGDSTPEEGEPQMFAS
jgi:hypothetical protein